MKGLVIGVAAGAVLVGVGAVLYEKQKAQENKGLPGGGNCESAETVWSEAGMLLSDPTITSKTLNDIALQLDTEVKLNPQDFCDDNARNAAHQAAASMRARADAMAAGKALPPVPGSQPPGAQFPLPSGQFPPLPVGIPGGTYVGSGWCPPGATYDAKSGLCTMVTAVTSGCADCGGYYDQ